MEIPPFLPVGNSKLNTDRNTTPNSEAALLQSKQSDRDLHGVTTEVTAGVMNSLFVTKALALMSTDFDSKLRKVPIGWPDSAPQFISHLIDVATKLAAWGYDEEVVAAGLLHDSIEDLPHLWDKARIASEFSPPRGRSG